MKRLKSTFIPREEFLKKWSKLRQLLYKTPQYKAFLLEVRTRAGYKCQRDRCMKSGRHVHHKVRVYDNPDMCLDPANGEFLCVACHRKEHAKEKH